MEILTDFDGLQEAMKKINLDESVMPYVNGRLVDSVAYNKTQKILDCPEMISAHKFLYNLDMDQLTEEEVEKINSLYKLGCDRGFITDDLTNWDEEDKASEAPEQNSAVVEPETKPVGGTLFKAKIPCWTVIYSATKDGDIKTGEAYSNAVSMSAAKADVNAKLSRIGYQNITILAIEATDDCNGNVQVDTTSVEENDMLNGRPHNNHVSEADKSEDETSEDDSTDKDDSTDEDEGEETEDDESAKEDTASSEDEADDKDDSTEDNDESTDEETDSDKSADDESDEPTDDNATENDDKDELDANEKAELKDQYRRVFKNVLSKCKFTTSFNDLTLEEKVKFFTELSKAWKKNEPNEFMTDKEIEQLNNVVVKEEPESNDDGDDDKE